MLNHFSKKRHFSSEITLMYCVWYGFERAIVENLRTDSLMIGNIRVSVLVSVVICLAAAISLVLIRKKQKSVVSEDNYTAMFEDEYADIVSEQLRYLPPQTVCERLTGDGDAEKLIAPMWSKNKRHVLNSIAHRLKEKDVWQGDLFTE